MTWPRSSTLPEVGAIYPLIKLKVVDLPAPFGPISAWRSPRATLNFRSRMIEILPKLKRSLKYNGRMILSGVLRTQERELRRALRSQKVDIMKVRRRGKWVAMLANCSGAL